MMGSNTTCVLKLAAGTGHSEVLIQFPWVYLNSENNHWTELGRVKVEEFHTWLMLREGTVASVFSAGTVWGLGRNIIVDN